MCVGKPKVPTVPDIPDRRAAVLPDAGDPSARASSRNRRKLSTSSMIFTKQGTLGIPSVGTGGGGMGG